MKAWTSDDARRVRRLARRAVLIGVTLALLGGCPSPNGDESTTTPFVLDDPELVARNNRGVGHMGRFEYDAARAIFAGIVDEHPNWLDAKVNLAIATFNRQQDGDEQTGLALLESVAAADPGHLRAHYCLGLLKLRAGRIDEALTHFRKVIEADPADPYAAYSVAQCEEGSDDAAALAGYLRSIELDPYMRSAYYRAFQLLQRAGRGEDAQRYFQDFQKLEDNPRAHLVEVVYTRMGPKAEAIAVDLANAPPPPAPTGPVFADEAPLPVTGDHPAWGADASSRPNVTAADIDADGALDLFIANAFAGDGPPNAVLLRRGDAWAVQMGHPLAAIAGVNAALWGDYDNDGRTDVYLCRDGANVLLRHDDAGGWADVTGATGTAGAALNTVDGAMFDADHDGDLDLFLVNHDGPNELFSNNLDGTFRPLAADQGLTGGAGSRSVVVVDLDRDRDTDIVVINDTPPHDVYVNDRLWSYRPATGMDAFTAMPLVAAVAGDVDADGAVELYVLTPEQTIARFTAGADGAWTRAAIAGPPPKTPDAAAESRLALIDTDGDGTPELLASTMDGWRAMRLGAPQTAPPVVPTDVMVAVSGARGWLPVIVDPARGPSIVALGEDGAPVHWAPGPGRHPFASLAFTGKDSKADSMRSNASGVGTHVAARVGSHWTVADSFRKTSGPGQSLQPVSIGLGSAKAIDFIAIEWSDGVFQSEMGLGPGTVHLIEEKQRQLSSCPVLFAWNGEKYEFVSDILGVGGIGFMLAPGQYTTPRPWERFLFPEGAIAPRDDAYAIRIGEPMEEACYLDAATFTVFDLPPGWRMTIDERMNVNGPAPTGAPLYYRETVLPLRATNERGDDVTASIAVADGTAAPVGPLDHRFIGRLAGTHTLTVEFAAPLAPDGRRPVLVIDGWVEYAYSQTMFAAWQAGADFRAPSLAARDSGGRWHTLHEQFGYPAGMPRQMALPLDELPEGTTALRLATNQEVYWDRIAIAYAEPCPDARVTTSAPRLARVAPGGFPRRTTGEQRQPHYDSAQRAPLWDTRHQSGLYTRFGDATTLVARTDDALAIIGPGEEIHLEYPVDPAPLPPGWTRRYVLDAAGWCKDMDLFTRDGETLEPLPRRGSGEVDPAVQRLHDRHNTRYESGR